MYPSFENKVALVTGAASGMGLATARAFAKAGASVLLADRQKADLSSAIADLTASGAKAADFPCDIADQDQIAELMQFAVTTYGRLDCAFNNAGVMCSQTPVAGFSLEEWDRVFAINVRGTLCCMQQEIIRMLEQGGGSIVNYCSIGSFVGVPNQSAYIASKHALLGLTRTAALEYVKQGIRINAICPGMIATPMMDKLTGGQAAQESAILGGVAAGRFGRPEEIADTILWLCSSGSSYVVGHGLLVDGVFMAG